MKRLIFIILLVALIPIVTLVSFWGGKQVCMLMMSGQTSITTLKDYSGLNLSAQQKQMLRGLEANFQKEAMPICMNICRERMNLTNLMADKNTNPVLIHKKIEEIGALQIGLEKKTADHILEIGKILTPEQSQAYLKEIQRELQNSIMQSGYSEALKS